MAMIIAEAGTGHYAISARERFVIAKKLIKAAAECGTDYVKFQMFVRDEELFCPMEEDEKRWERWKNTVMGLSYWEDVKFVCQERKVGFMASVFQHGALGMYRKLEPDYYKVASRAVRTFPYDRVAGPFIVSGGNPVIVKNKEYELLWCVSDYPCPLEKAGWLDVFDGLSDHSGTVWPAIDALARGAKVVEVHFRINDEPSPDLESSLSLEQLKLVCEARDALAQMRQD